MLFFLSLIAYAAGIVKDCNISSIFRPTFLGLTPDPPVVGQQIRLSVLFNNPGPAVSDGRVTTSVTLNYLPLSPTTEPLCHNTGCPLVAGPNDRSTVSTWPDVRGNIVTKSVWNSVEGDNLLCVQTSVKVGNKRLRVSENATTELYRDDVSLKQIAIWINYSY